MGLPTPNLDDRKFQDFVDEAKRLVQRRCPEWTDHNVSDPGVTLIETFAYMVDQLVYRLNRVPEKHYLKFLELIGVRLFPPTVAHVPVTFWLTTSQPENVVIGQGTQVSTPKVDDDDPVVFETTAPLTVVAATMQTIGTQVEGGDMVDTTGALGLGQGFAAFSPQPRPGDVLLFGLTRPAPSNAVLLELDCRIEGVGVDPTDPPLVWEAWTGRAWTPCDLERDETGGLNRAGEVVVHVPTGHTASVLNSIRAGWLRARVTEPEEGQPFYSSTPRILRATAQTIGGTVDAVNATRVTEEILGLSEGVPGQRFPLQQRPVAAGPTEIEVAGGNGWELWREVDTFADSDPTDHHFLFDTTTAEIVFGPAVREADGTFTSYGAVPPKGAPIRIVSYLVGGGARGNISPKQVTRLLSSNPIIQSVTNRYQGTGGVDGETVEAAKRRGPILLRTRNRAVTAEDYEELARSAAPEVARIRCTPAEGADAGNGVRLLVVPEVAPQPDGSLRFEDLVPTAETMRRIADYLDERRCVGTRLVVEPPSYQGITVVARLRAKRRVAPDRLRAEAVRRLFRYFDPVHGGPDGRGWPFGRPIHVGEVYAVLQRLDGVEFVEDARLFGADPITGQRGEQVQRIDLDNNALVFSYGHQVMAEASL